MWCCLGLGFLAKFSFTIHINTLSRLNQTCPEARSRINFQKLWCWDRSLEPQIQIPWGFLIFFFVRVSYQHKFCITLLSNRLSDTFKHRKKFRLFKVWDPSGPWAEFWGCYLWILSLSGYTQETVLMGKNQHTNLNQEITNKFTCLEGQGAKIKS